MVHLNRFITNIFICENVIYLNVVKYVFNYIVRDISNDLIHVLFAHFES